MSEVKTEKLGILSKEKIAEINAKRLQQYGEAISNIEFTTNETAFVLKTLLDKTGWKWDSEKKDLVRKEKTTIEPLKQEETKLVFEVDEIDWLPSNYKNSDGYTSIEDFKSINLTVFERLKNNKHYFNNPLIIGKIKLWLSKNDKYVSMKKLS